MGIARHARPLGPIETIDHVHVSVDLGVAGDYRGAVKPGGKGTRQVTVMESEDWAVAARLVGCELPWWSRRANLLSQGIELPKRKGARVRIGGVLLEVTGETKPCSRMDELHPGLRAALKPNWRGGILTRVIMAGDVAVSDVIVIEEV